MELLIKQITLKFPDKCAVDNVSFSLKEGVHVLMGENGAGKSTLLRIISGVLKPDSGTVTLCRRDPAMGGYEFSPILGRAPVSKTLVPAQEAYRNILGYLPQEFGFYPEFTGRDFLLYLASLKGLDKKHADLRAGELLKQVSMEETAGKKIRTYSSGMRKRLGVAQLLLNSPKLLVLDEPTAGLDPVEQFRFLDLIKKLGKENIVLLSSHTAAEAEAVADSVLLMKNGRLVFCGKPDLQNETLEELFIRYTQSGCR